MISQDDYFEYKIPTHIEFTLYTKDEYENLVIKSVKKYCKNYSDEEGVYLVKASSFLTAMLKNKKIRTEFEKNTNLNMPEFKVNSIIFLKSIFFSFINLHWITFYISDKENLHKVDKTDKKFLSFDFQIKEGIVDLSSILTIDELNRFNKELILDERMSNKYISRSPYIYLTLLDLFHFLDNLEGSESILLGAMLDQFDAKFETRNPMLLLKTDYSML